MILGLAFCHMVPDSSGLAEMTDYGGLNGALILLGFMINLCFERLSIDLTQRKQVLEEDIDSAESSEIAPVVALSVESPATSAQLVPEEPTRATVNNTPPMHAIESTQKFKDSKAVITAHVVEVGVIVHTVLLGISIGTWTEDRASLIIFTIAMAFHQFFEGIGLGAIVSVASNIPLTKRVIMVVVFSLSFPLSICAGIAISLQTSDPTTDELVAGLENAAAPVARRPTPARRAWVDFLAETVARAKGSVFAPDTLCDDSAQECSSPSRVASSSTSAQCLSLQARGPRGPSPLFRHKLHFVQVPRSRLSSIAARLVIDGRS